MAESSHFGDRRFQKGLIASFIILFAFTAFILPYFFASAFAEAESASEDVPVSSRGAASVVIEASSGRVLSKSNAFTPMPMASTTKILTAITVIEHMDVDKTVTVSAKAAGVEGSSIYLKTGEKWKVKDLLYGLMLRSGNDAATQLAISCAGSVSAFATLMNDTAYLAGAYHSHFVNPHGLHDPDHYTTAYDLALITAYAMRNPLFRDVVSAKRYTFTRDGVSQTFVNKNKMLSSYEGAVGVKTGYTKVAGRCLVSAACRNGMLLVSVVLNEYDMWYRSADLLDAAFSRYRLYAVWQAGEVRTVDYRGVPTPITVRQTCYYPLTEAEYNGLRYEFSLLGVPSSGDLLGDVFVFDGDRVIFRSAVYNALSSD